MSFVFEKFSTLQIDLMPFKMRKSFLFFLVPLAFTSCAKKVHEITQIEPYVNTSIDSSMQADPEMEAFILPFKEKMDAEMNQVLTYTPIDLPKDGFNTPLGNLNCDMVMEESNLIYEKRHGKKIDICVLNWGGMRRSFGKGELTLKNAYELMPFDNMAWVVTMKGSQLEGMVKYLSESEFGHPIAGMTFTPYDMSSLKVQGKPYEPNTIYTIVTNDFLLNGGDNMLFFKDALTKEDLDRKLRDMIIDQFTKYDTLTVNTDKRILK
jgi:2',3'-cyclic-nucleotide 2'-phosphodiesterase (5'-nucleotidase family)